MNTQKDVLDSIDFDTDLPSVAYHPEEEEFEYENERVQKAELDGYPYTTSSVTQLLRVALKIGGLQNGLDLCRKVTQYQLEYEEEHVFSDFVVDRDNITKSKDPWLRTELNRLADEKQEILNKEKNTYENRVEWLTSDNAGHAVIPSLRTRIRNTRDVINNGGFKQMVVFQKEKDIPEHLTDNEYVTHEGVLSNELPLESFGITTPIRLLVCESTSGSMYPFVPWCGVTACTGPDKHANHNSTTTLCKHEIAGLVLKARNEFDPSGFTIPERHRRFVSPQGYTRFMNNINPDS